MAQTGRFELHFVSSRTIHVDISFNREMSYDSEKITASLSRSDIYPLIVNNFDL